MAKLFLSYAREDVGIAGRLARALERSGEHDVWWDRDLHGGASFGTEIEEQLSDCEAVIVLWSAAAVKSPWVRDEAAIGRDAGKLIPTRLGDIEPPIGFRQFHTIDLGRHGRPSSAAITKLEESITHVTRSAAPAELARASPSRIRPAHRFAIVAILLLIAAAGGLYWWRSSGQSAITVAVLPGTGPHDIVNDYANALATDMVAFLSAQGQSVSVLDASDPHARSATYRFNVGYSGQGASAATTLSMWVRGQEGIIWSGSWSGENASAVDLKKQLSFGASRALLCALQTSNQPSLSPSLLKLFIAGCSSLYSGDEPTEQTAADFSQITDQQPGFASAWENLAIVRSLIFFNQAEDRSVGPPALRESALVAIQRARRLVPDSGKVLFAEANLAHGNWQQRLALLDRAISADPKEAMFYAARSGALQNVGRMTDAIADADTAVQLDPLSPTAAAYRIGALMYGGRFANAREEIARAYKIWPDNLDILSVDLGYSMRYGDPRQGEQLVNKALASYSDEENQTAREVLLAREKPTPANVEDALNRWRAAMTTKDMHAAATTQYLLALGTFGKMDDAWNLVSDPKTLQLIVPQTFFRPEFRSMRHDRRFMVIAAQYGLLRYWRSTGHWPDFCNDSRLPYDCKREAARLAGT